MHVGQTDRLYNAAFREHREQSEHCDGHLHMDIPNEIQWGLNWKERIKCDTCGYMSEFEKLYKEVEAGPGPHKGRKASTANVGLQLGLSKLPIGSESFRLLCLSADIPPPSSSGLQKAANRVSTRIKEENILDMKTRREEIKLVNKYRGCDENKFSVSTDGAYNNPLHSGVGHTPFQPATQVTYVATENQTSDHQVLALVTKSKLCSKHSKIDNTSCLADPNCTADLHTAQSIGNEKLLAKECLKDLKEDDIEIEFITTDADSSAFSAATEMYMSGDSETCPVSFLDTRHTAKSQRTFIKNSKSVIDMMPASTKQGKQNLAGKFGLDCSTRCIAEFSAAHKLYGGDFVKMKRAVSYACDAIAYCYMGNHSKCQTYSFSCKGETERNWVHQCGILDKKFKIEENEENFLTLRTCTDFRLGPHMLEKTRCNLNTQKCEATNKALRHSLPRHTTFARNFQGRAHSAVHSVNCRSSARSISELQRRLGCSVSKNGKVDMAMRKKHSKVLKSKAYKLTAKSKCRRSSKKRALYNLHSCKELHYSKDMLLPKSSTVRKVKEKVDHSYSKKSIVRKN